MEYFGRKHKYKQSDNRRVALWALDTPTATRNVAARSVLAYSLDRVSMFLYGAIAID